MVFYVSQPSANLLLDSEPLSCKNDTFNFKKPSARGFPIMYAVIQTGGKQYRVKEGEYLKVETLPVEAGEQIEFDKVLLIQNDAGITFGKPFVEGGKVTATIRSHGRHKKVHIIKFRRRKHYMKKQGHRQNYTEIEITGISG